MFCNGFRIRRLTNSGAEGFNDVLYFGLDDPVPCALFFILARTL